MPTERKAKAKRTKSPPDEILDALAAVETEKILDECSRGLEAFLFQSEAEAKLVMAGYLSRYSAGQTVTQEKVTAYIYANVASELVERIRLLCMRRRLREAFPLVFKLGETRNNLHFQTFHASLVRTGRDATEQRREAAKASRKETALLSTDDQRKRLKKLHDDIHCADRTLSRHKIAEEIYEHGTFRNTQGEKFTVRTIESALEKVIGPAKAHKARAKEVLKPRR